MTTTLTGGKIPPTLNDVTRASMSNAIVYNALMYYHVGEMSLTDALMLAVVEMAEQNAALKKQMIDHINSCATPMAGMKP